jgi:hypothetical protein
LIYREKAKKNQSLGGKIRGTKNELLQQGPKALIEPMDVRKELSNEAGVSTETLRRYNKIKEKGGPEMLEKVMSGEMKIGTAYRMIEPENIARLRETKGLYKILCDILPFDNEEDNIDAARQIDELTVLLGNVIANHVRSINENGIEN